LNSTVRVIINGSAGKMGRVTCSHITREADLVLAAETGRRDDLAVVIRQTKADVVIDFTTPQAVFKNTQDIIAAGACPVIGTSGLSLEQIHQLSRQCEEKRQGGIIAPNFSIGAALMMRYAKDAVKYLSDVEIIEMHHPQKLDAPSGTAMQTAQMIAEVRPNPAERRVHKDLARGDNRHGVTIHSVRLPNLFSHQSVLFAGAGEMLSITHDGRDRSCCMPGVFMACRQVMKLDHLVYGLEHLLQ